MSVTSQAEKARQSALKLQGYSTDDKNKVLSAIAECISAYKDFIISENKKDLDIFPDKTSALFDRLLLNEKRVMQMVESRTILDAPGANQLIGRGDLLFSQGGDTNRVQCAFVDTPEAVSYTHLTLPTT